MSVRYGLLALLEHEPMYGYQLRPEFEASTGGTWPLNVGQVYTTLSRLERDGLVEGPRRGRRGPARLLDHRRRPRRGPSLVRHPGAAPAAPRDELAIKLALAVTTPGVDVGAVVQAPAHRHRTRAAGLHPRPRGRRGRAVLAAGADSLIFAAEAEIRWLDHCETRLARLQPLDPDPASPAAARPAQAARR